VGQQLTLDLNLRPALGRDDFLVTPSNAAAVALVDQWPDWPSFGAVLAGPPGSGKSHLAEVWRQSAEAEIVECFDLSIDQIPELLCRKALLVEDVGKAVVPEQAMFHLLNYARQNNKTLLFTTTQWPLLNISLPDLQSRFQALPYATIMPPDDALLRGVLVKLFDDRQIAVDETLISYLLARMPRSLDMARQLVERIDKAALEQGAEVTKAFAGRVLAEIERPEFL
jgi:chromosomal replication initiation ATPase DnaA